MINEIDEYGVVSFMRPVLRTKSADNDSLLESLISCITALNCASHFGNHLGRLQTEQATIVRSFQYALRNALAHALPAMTWKLEHLPTPSVKDSIDIFGTDGRTHVVIELDKHRADQVTKKFVSRSAMFERDKIHYISICYPGTDRMNMTECIKYFRYCASLSARLGNVYAGFIIQPA